MGIEGGGGGEPRSGGGHAKAIDGFNYRAWHYKNIHVTKTGSHFVGQKGNQINRVSLVIQYSNQVFENKEQLANIDIEYLFSLVVRNNFRA